MLPRFSIPNKQFYYIFISFLWQFNICEIAASNTNNSVIRKRKTGRNKHKQPKCSCRWKISFWQMVFQSKYVHGNLLPFPCTFFFTSIQTNDWKEWKEFTRIGLNRKENVMLTFIVSIYLEFSFFFSLPICWKNCFYL